MDLVPLSKADPLDVETLLDRAFGAARHARTAYKVRGPAPAIPGLSFAAMEDGTLVGSVQCWPVMFRGDDGTERPLVMLGPVAVDPQRQRGGVGRLLVERALAAADGAGERALTLIGDPEYYGRFFGFTAERTGRWRLPGPVERHRLLARGPDVPDMPGALGPLLDAGRAAA